MVHFVVSQGSLERHAVLPTPTPASLERPPSLPTRVGATRRTSNTNARIVGTSTKPPNPGWSDTPYFQHQRPHRWNVHQASQPGLERHAVLPTPTPASLEPPAAWSIPGAESAPAGGAVTATPPAPGSCAIGAACARPRRPGRPPAHTTHSERWQSVAARLVSAVRASRRACCGAGAERQRSAGRASRRRRVRPASRAALKTYRKFSQHRRRLAGTGRVTDSRKPGGEF